MSVLTVAEVARESGVNGSAVRFYEAHGLIDAQRTSGGQRRFDDQAACRIRIARVAQRIGLSVREIRDVLAALPPSPTPEDWAALHARLMAEAKARIDELTAALDEIRSGDRLCEV